ncbi:hypothetical protein LOD99_981 [Oopsacas minuta]|uniref:EDR1/CTR1/ARMC3-like peptidase-like domain-containing protein n=1 Tax=Oopsacas minuta TaxID=111878 RepID=A0AAV7K0H0_9METZ|nr:hypothetical protein LOD99_981 [Oopsacas minuta]
MPAKKTKETETVQSLESFAPLDITTRDIRTAVLMLDSTEDILIAQVCEAIYKYSSFSDANRIELLSLDLLSKLVSKLKSPEKAIRAHAAMCMGSLSAVSEGRRAIGELDCFQQLTCLLVEEEEIITKEAVTLLFSHLAFSFSSKLKIHESGAIDKLIKLMTLPNADIQRNVIKTFSLLLECHQARNSLLESNGIPPVVELLQSEYAIIQELSLITLSHCTRDAKVRTALREVGGLTPLVAFIGNPEVSDLHVHALRVLSHCLEEMESLEQIQSSGLLESLLEHIGNATLPEVKQFAAEALCRACKSAPARRLFYEQGAVKVLVGLVGDDNPRVCIAGCHALAALTQLSMAKEQLGHEEIGGLGVLVSVLSRDSQEQEGEVKESTLSALFEATLESSQNKSKVSGDLRGLEVLIPLLSHSRSPVQAKTAAVLENFSLIEGYRLDILQLGVVKIMIEELSSTDKKVRAGFCRLLACLSTELLTATHLVTHQGYNKLVQLLIDPEAEVRKAAGWVVSVLVSKPDSARDLCGCGCLQILQEVEESSELRSIFSSRALEGLLSTNLVAKFWTIGRLGEWDSIEDGFYEVGSSSHSVEFRSLEELSKLPLSDKLTAVCVNSRAEEKEVPVVEEKKEETLAKERSKSRKGADSQTEKKSSKKSSKVDKELKEEEEVPSEPSEPVFSIPTDQPLQEMVPEVISFARSAENSRETVRYIAKLVSDQMGGEVEKSSLGSFDYHLHLSQLKYNRQSNLLPIGLIRQGFFQHRALLFKFLSDQTGIRSTLVRGEYGRAWNEVMLPDPSPDPTLTVPSRPYVVDLFHEPGRLMRQGSPQASLYQHI